MCTLLKLRNCRFSPIIFLVLFFFTPVSLFSFAHRHSDTHPLIFISVEAAPGNLVSTGGFYLEIKQMISRDLKFLAYGNSDTVLSTNFIDIVMLSR